jgi:hypothetical protein
MEIDEPTDRNGDIEAKSARQAAAKILSSVSTLIG